MDRPPTALLFPGQGSQAAGMREDAQRHRPDLLELAEREAPGLFERVEEGTRYAQPAVYCASLAGYARLGDTGADLHAGHSLGEIAALAAAGALAHEDGLRLVCARGRLMDEAAESAGLGGGMLALLGSGERSAEAIAARHDLTVANDNAPGQVVLSGAGANLEAASSEAKDAGLRAMRLPVIGAFHSPAMASALPEWEAVLAGTPFGEPRVPVLSGVTAAPFDDVRRRLAESLTHPVRWRETLIALHARGIRRVVETGPGRVLVGLAKRTLEGVEATTAERVEAAARA